MRTIVVNQQIWKWQVGRSNVVARCGKLKRVIGCAKLCGVTPDDYERAERKGNAYAITPKMIADFIQTPA